MTSYTSAPCEKCGGKEYHKKTHKCIACVEAFKRKNLSKSVNAAFARQKAAYKGKTATKAEFDKAMRGVCYD